MQKTVAHRCERHSCCGGFTLVELMLVVAIISVLSSVALSSYSGYVQKARRADGVQAVLDMAARQERHMSINNVYSSVASDLGYGTLPHSVTTNGKEAYRLTVSVAPTGDGFEARATPVNEQVKDTECFTYVIDHTGRRFNLSASAAVLNTQAKCW